MVTVDRLTDIGTTRERNEDSYIFFECKLDGKDITIAVVCDGMGGLDAGDYASKTMCETIRKEVCDNNFETVAELNRAITLAIKNGNKTIFQTKTQYGNQCGTTVSCVLLTEGKGYAWHVGDSRIVKVTGQAVTLMTQDHTLVGKLVSQGRITEKEALRHPKRNVLVNAIGVFKDVTIDRFEFEYENSTIVVSSDGFWHGITNKDYTDLSNQSVSLDSLFNKVMQKGETDNITAVVLHC